MFSLLCYQLHFNKVLKRSLRYMPTSTHTQWPRSASGARWQVSHRHRRAHTRPHSSQAFLYSRGTRSRGHYRPAAVAGQQRTRCGLRARWRGGRDGGSSPCRAPTRTTGPELPNDAATDQEGPRAWIFTWEFPYFSMSTQIFKNLFRPNNVCLKNGRLSNFHSGFTVI